MQSTPPAKRLRLATPVTGPARLQRAPIDNTPRDDDQPNVLAYFAQRDSKLRDLEQQLKDAQQQALQAKQEATTARSRMEHVQREASRAQALHHGELATLAAERDSLLARLQQQGAAAAAPPPQAPLPLGTAEADRLRAVLHEQQQQHTSTVHNLQQQLMQQQQHAADAAAALREELEAAVRRAQSAETMRKSLQQQADRATQLAEQAQQQRAELQAANAQLEKQLAQAAVGTSRVVVDDQQGDAALVRTLRAEVARLEQDVIEARRLKQYMRNVETLQNSLEAAESRATQLAARLAIVEAEAAESAPRAQELSRWQVLMQRLQPGSNGPEALQRLVEGLQRDVASRAEAAATLQTKAAELQGRLDAALDAATSARQDIDRHQAQLEQVMASECRAKVDLELAKQERDALQQLVQLNMDEAAQQGLEHVAAVRQQLITQQAVRTGLEGRVQAAESLVLKAETRARELQAAAHEWESRAQGLERRLNAAESEAAALGAQAAVLQQRLGRGEYDPAITRVLHMAANPESAAREAAYRAKIDSLTQELSTLRGHLNGPTQGPALSDALRGVLEKKVADLEKRNKRLQEVFKQQILHFREACFFLFGYRVDMAAPSTASLSGCTVRLVPGADERRELVFRFDAHGRPRLFPTAYTQQQLGAAVALFLDKEDCVPAFTANLTMDLFNSREAG